MNPNVHAAEGMVKEGEASAGVRDLRLWFSRAPNVTQCLYCIR